MPNDTPAVPPTPTSVESGSLKPCPFCGGAAQLWGEDSTWAKLCRVSCTVCYANAGQYVETRAAAVENWNRRPAVLPTTSVEEARQQLAKWPQSMNREEFLVDVDALIASVRAEERAKVRVMVEGMQGYDTPRYDDIGMQESYTGHGEWLDRNEVLAGLAKMEGK